MKIKVKMLPPKGCNFLLGKMHFTSDDGFQNIVAYQPVFNTLKYKNMTTEYVISWKSKVAYNSKLSVLNSDFLANRKSAQKFCIKNFQSN